MSHVDEITLHELVRDDELKMRDLIWAVQRQDVFAGAYIDEELLLCSRDSEADPDPHWMPYLASMDASAREVAMQTTIRHVEALGGLKRGEDDDTYELIPPHSVIAHAFSSAQVAITWDWQVVNGGGHTGGLLVLPSDVVLHDDIYTRRGQHELVFRNTARQAVHLAAVLDPGGAARRTQQPIVATSVEELSPSPEELAATAVSSSVVAKVRKDRQGSMAQFVTAYGTQEGLWLLQGRRGDDPMVSLQLVSEKHLIDFAGRWLQPRNTP